MTARRHRRRGPQLVQRRQHILPTDRVPFRLDRGGRIGIKLQDVVAQDRIKPRGVSTHVMRIRLQARAHRNDRLFWRLSVRQIEFPATVEAHLIRAVFNREHTAEVTVPAAKEKLKDPHE